MANNKDIPYLTSPDKSFIASSLSDEQIAAQKIAKAYRQHERKTFDDVAFDSMQKATPELSVMESDKTRADLLGYKADTSTADVHKALMAAGMTPGLGNIADLVDATLYALEGEFGEAGLSLAAIAPMAGQMVTAKRALKAAKESGEKMVTLYRGVKKWHPGEMVKDGKFVGPKVVSGKDVGVAHSTAKSRSLFVTNDPLYAASKTRSDFPLYREKILEGMKESKMYYSDRGFPVWPESKMWNQKDFAEAIKKQERLIEDVRVTRRLEKEGDFILEFEVPASWVVKFGNKLPEAYEGTILFEKGLPKGFLKKVHK